LQTLRHPDVQREIQPAVSGALTGLGDTCAQLLVTFRKSAQHIIKTCLWQLSVWGGSPEPSKPRSFQQGSGDEMGIPPVSWMHIGHLHDPHACGHGRAGPCLTVLEGEAANGINPKHSGCKQIGVGRGFCLFYIVDGHNRLEPVPETGGVDLF
jgi:hypothetical protein